MAYAAYGVNNNYVPQQNNNTYVQQPRTTIYTQYSTKNQSFLMMHQYLQSMGIRKNDFMLSLLDPDLDGVNPYDPALNLVYKHKVFRECITNYWYFLREVVRLPSPKPGGDMYELNRGNMAYNWCSVHNLNVFFEMPRQLGKTTAVDVRYLYIYNFGATNSKLAILHKNMGGSKDNLDQIRTIRDMLPEYLRFKEFIDTNGKIVRGKNNTTELVNPCNHNNIKTFASATNKTKAASILRGKTLHNIWFDEFGFIPYNDTVYMNGAPAFNTASNIARQNNVPYGITITTTPGFMATDEGKYAYDVKELATRFSELWYDFDETALRTMLSANVKSNFVYIKYNYQELGKSEEWFESLCKLLNYSWKDIRREVLLEWSTSNENSPFDPDDLEVIRTLLYQPIAETNLLGKYTFKTYLTAMTNVYPPIIGVDVAAGYKKDSSCITVIDSLTTKPIGVLNCNYISTTDLALCIKEIVSWMPNAIVNVERNGVGQGVISALIKMGLKKNLYYEIKDRTIEERQDGVHSYKHKVRVKEYGLNSTAAIRKKLIDILMERVQNHKDKIICDIIYNELLGMEVKKNGKVEHSVNTHDDQIFSMLMALYVWYEGVNLAERYGIHKTSIKTDDDIDEACDVYESDTVEIVGEFDSMDDDLRNDIYRDLQFAIAAGGTPLNDYLEKQRQEEERIFNKLLQTPLGEKAYREKYSIPDDIPISRYINTYQNEFEVPDSVFEDFYTSHDHFNPEFDIEDRPFLSTVPEGQIGLLQGQDGYDYRKHFNF